jgi:hypothetical protein
MQSVPITTDVSLNLNQGDVYNVCQWLATAAEKYIVSIALQIILLNIDQSGCSFQFHSLIVKKWRFRMGDIPH